jgi:hypothetical protein
VRHQPGDPGRLTFRPGELPSIEPRPDIEGALAQIDSLGRRVVVDLKSCHVAHRSRLV